MTARPQLADITAVIGGTGTGKTYWMLGQVRAGRPARLLAWDPEGEFSKLGTVTRDLGEVVRLTEGDRWAVIYEPPFDRDRAERAFNLFCRIAFKRGEQGRAPLVLVDELATVVRAGSAPAYWTACISRGRKRGLSIIAASQRPASIDKTFWSQATRIRCTALGYEADQRAMAAALGVPVLEVQRLNGFAAIERDRNRPTAAKGAKKA